MKIVGSTALKHFGLNRREPSDLDIWTTDPTLVFGGDRVDIHVVPQQVLDLMDDGKYASPDDMYTIKCSHLGWRNPMWNKHKLDILWLKSQGCKLKEKLYKALVKHWKVKLDDKSFLSLNQNKEDFFTDNVTYIYDHDYLHELVAHPNRPMYEKVLKDGQEVLVDKTKFRALPLEDQVRLFREEITVIACERWLLNPKAKEISWNEAYRASLEKTIVSLTKGWATDFIVQNLDLFYRPDRAYFEHILKTLGDKRHMSVDMTIFEDVLADEQTELEDEEYYSRDLNTLVYQMCTGYAYIPEKFGYELLDSKPGMEGGGEHCHGVFKLDDKIYKAEYYYYSYNGDDFDYITNTLKEVKPVQKTITVYE